MDERPIPFLEKHLTFCLLRSIAIKEESARSLCCHGFNCGPLAFGYSEIFVLGSLELSKLKVLVVDVFGHKVSNSRIDLIEDRLCSLSAEPGGGKLAQTAEWYSSIRKAKGLQADAVLVVAKSLTELKKWLQTKHSFRVADKQDKCRLGYVAFTRPREMLCIACITELDSELIQMLQSLGVLIVTGGDARDEKVSGVISV